LRTPAGILNNCQPWCKVQWTIEEHFDNATINEPARSVVLLDDIDQIGGNDVIYGLDGEDVIHGQHGDDIIWGGPGDDELFGEEGGDQVYGEEGNDVVLGDSGWVVRRSGGYGPGKVWVITYKDAQGNPHLYRDIVLEETAVISQVVPISTAQPSVGNSLANNLFASDYILLSGAYHYTTKPLLCLMN
jgi:Ca2+-binding RTX toxin-like protein